MSAQNCWLDSSWGPPGSTLSAGFTGMYIHAFSLKKVISIIFFIWVPRIQTQVLVFAEQALLPTTSPEAHVVDWICISLVTREVRHLFECSLATHALENSLFNSFVCLMIICSLAIQYVFWILISCQMTSWHSFFSSRACCFTLALVSSAEELCTVCSEFLSSCCPFQKVLFCAQIFKHLSCIFLQWGQCFRSYINVLDAFFFTFFLMAQGESEMQFGFQPLSVQCFSIMSLELETNFSLVCALPFVGKEVAGVCSFPSLSFSLLYRSTSVFVSAPAWFCYQGSVVQFGIFVFPYELQGLFCL